MFNRNFWRKTCPNCVTSCGVRYSRTCSKLKVLLNAASFLFLPALFLFIFFSFSCLLDPKLFLYYFGTLDIFSCFLYLGFSHRTWSLHSFWFRHWLAHSCLLGFCMARTYSEHKLTVIKVSQNWLLVRVFDDPVTHKLELTRIVCEISLISLEDESCSLKIILIALDATKKLRYQWISANSATDVGCKKVWSRALSIVRLTFALAYLYLNMEHSLSEVQ